ncbi:MAG: NADP-dependent malic enzyme [bacterium ADurb.Bin270]|nr:malate dehydrogenase [Myxococcales bacterium]OQA62261.1 MAG: NADP-dependent malic enzyme [bacterium ADurb.Bin270]HQG13355.1 malic enzyme-like NAD(P)-binding protein [bacterium]
MSNCLDKKESIKAAALKYHSEGRPGKIELGITKPCKSQWDLSLAYTPGVAEPCREIKKNPALVHEYTARGNLVGVITNGTAVLGLGDIGPLAGKPVMEGKGVLFKRFADIDVFDIEIDEKDPEKFIEIVRSLEPTFGGINLEDVKSPECFDIENALKDSMKIPVFHDDQHGTAIIVAAGFINAMELVGKKASEVKVVFSGAGAAAVACAHMLESFGVNKDNIFMYDIHGLVTCDRIGAESHRGRFAKCIPHTEMAEIMYGADVFIGLSAGGVVSKEMIKSMAKCPVVFAMANPDPEIMPEDVMAVRPDAIVATGRSDYPNQINNVLGFPFIFRGALDVVASKINEEMKRAAALSLASLAKEPVPPEVLKAYGLDHLEFGKDYLIPKALDPRVLLWEAPAVAEAAMRSGVATRKINDMDLYRKQLEKRISLEDTNCLSPPI